MPDALRREPRERATRLQTESLNVLLRCTSEAVVLLNRLPGSKAVVFTPGFAVEKPSQLLGEAVAITAFEEGGCLAAGGDFKMHRQIAEDAGEAIGHRFKRNQWQSFGTQRWIDEDGRIPIEARWVGLEAGELNVQMIGRCL